jgi:hypothetical protein
VLIFSPIAITVLLVIILVLIVIAFILILVIVTFLIILVAVVKLAFEVPTAIATSSPALPGTHLVPLLFLFLPDRFNVIVLVEVETAQ